MHMKQGKMFREIKRAFRLLNKRDKLRLSQVTLLQVVFGVMDLIGVAAVGVLTALAIRGVRSQGPGDRVERILQVTGLNQFEFKFQIALLSVISVVIFSGKTIFSVFFLRKTLFYMSKKSSAISSELTSKLLNQSQSYISRLPIQERLFALTVGVSNITIGVFTTMVLIVSDSTLLIVLLVGLLFVDPVICFLTLIVFSGIGCILYYLLNARAAKMSAMHTKETILSNQSIVEALTAYREILVRGSREFYSEQIKSERFRLSKYEAELKFLPNISKYTTELTMVVGIALISALQFARYDANRAIAVLSVFLAASTRIAPAVMRLQQNAITLKTYLASSEPTLSLAEDLRKSKKLENPINKLEIDHVGFEPSISFSNVTFRYESSSVDAVKNLSFEVQAGKMIAIVGPSGGGKSTLVDLLLGIAIPQSGSVLVGDFEPSETLRKWPGAVGFVPQDIYVSNRSLRENICLGLDTKEISESLIWKALEESELEDFVKSVEGQLDYLVGENGSNLSGGQRQRLGIARALLSQPKLIILDEATSALDSETENKISEAITRLKGKSTIVVVAHRLSTVRKADTVLYLEDGCIIDSGTFDELKNKNSNFQKQAEFMGL